MSNIRHNGGPTMEKGRGWRRYAWKRARAELLPKMPIEVVRRRVKRARELGIDYKAYAGIRAATGRDVIALLFSDNALRLRANARLPSDRAAHLDALRGVEGLVLTHPPLTPEMAMTAHPILVAADRAPGLIATWPEIRERIWTLKGNLPADGVVVIGETWLERDWCAAARLAGFLPADSYFAPR
ncbi:MAG: hypothetical protein AAGK71_09845 [Pseudomonadota bacterium]